MPYVLRNMLFIGIFWLILLIAGVYYVNSTMAGKARILHQQNSEKESRVKDLEALQDDQTVLLEHLERLRSISMGEIGALVSQEKPGELFQYILNELKMTKGDMSINLVHESNTVRPGFTSREYNIEGESPYKDVYNLVYNLEKGPIFFNVKNVTLRAKEDSEENKKKNVIEYSITVESYNRDSGPDIKEISMEQFSIEQMNPIFINATSQLVMREEEKQSSQGGGFSGGDSKPKTQESSTAVPGELAAAKRPAKVITINDYKILGMTNRSVILQSPSGASEKIRPGQSLKDALLTEIDLLNGKAIFQVNQNGVNRRIELLK